LISFRTFKPFFLLKAFDYIIWDIIRYVTLNNQLFFLFSGLSGHKYLNWTYDVYYAGEYYIDLYDLRVIN